MNNNELISVIIPTYKRSETLERAIKSVLNQTYKDIEIIVVDDNADYPEFREQNEKIVSKYHNVRFIKNKKNMGGGLSRNVGIKEAAGEIVAFLDDDDEYLPRKLELQYELYRRCNDKKTALIYCYANMVNVSGGVYVRKRDVEGCNIIENTKNCIAATSWWLCSKKALLEVGGFEDIKSRQDASLIMKLMLSGYSVYRVPDVLLNYYWHSHKNGISNNTIEAIKAEEQYFKIFEERSHGLDEHLKNEVRYYFYYRRANLLAVNNRTKEAWFFFKKMRAIHVIKKETTRIFFRIIFNRLYTKASAIKNRRRVGS